jgi:hypothetical protein
LNTFPQTVNSHKTVACNIQDYNQWNLLLSAKLPILLCPLSSEKI